jgi:Zn-dependent M28 family amino/carboxypeptidase
MRKALFAALITSLLSILSLAQEAPPRHFDGNTWWDQLKVLADDKMEGRDTGSTGEKKAQAYVVEQLKKNGLEPAGTDGFYQPVKFISRQIVEKDSSLALVRDGKTEPLKLGDEAIFSTRIDLAPEVNAPLVFVGYGLKIPEMKIDDFAGLDLKGKVAVLFTGSPANVPSSLSAHAQSLAERWKGLQEAGAIGYVSLPNPAFMDIPWSRIALNRAHPSMDLAYDEFNETPGAKLLVTFNPAKAEILFAGTGHTFEEIAALGKERKPLPRFPLTASIKAKTKVDTKHLESSNVVTKLPGTDAALKNEYVILSAHIDHVGIGESINGDRIYNGAMDNGSGSALLLDVAASLKRSPEKLRRSLLFIFVTGEEKGLLGSKYFAAHPTVPAKSIVADLNEDMFLPIIPLKTLTVYGLAESDLGDWAQQAAAKYGVTVQPDPQPLRNAFIRSDQYNFIRHGVPALAMGFGFAPNSPEQQAFKDWLTLRYHAPSDDLQQPVDKAAAGQFEDIYRTLAVAVANAETRPQWKQDSFFRRYAEGN